MTQVVHNFIIGAMFIPFLCPLFASMGGNQITMFLIIYSVLQAAYITPAASPSAAVIHGEDTIQTKDAYFWGVVNLILNILMLSILAIPLGDLLFA